MILVVVILNYFISVTWDVITKIGLISGQSFIFIKSEGVTQVLPSVPLDIPH